MSKPYRIALGSIFIECNHLVSTRIDIHHFQRTELRRGKEVLEANNGVVGGMLKVLREHKAEIVPLILASSVPGGPLTSDCYRQLKGELLNALAATLPVDGALLALHGSGTVEDVDDLEGDLLGAVRDLAGPKVPVVATLDCHAHVTQEMVRCADALLAWETYPHRDTYTTGERGAQVLLDTLDGRIRPSMAMGKVPMLACGVLGHTEGPGPFADIMRFAKTREGQEGVVSTSVFLVHPYLDLPGLGGGGLVVANGDMEKAETLASEIAQRLWERRFDLEPIVHTPAEAIAEGLQIDAGPVLLVETADCAGGGAAGDSVATLCALLEASVPLSLVPVVDPEAALQCHEAGAGREVKLSLGHKLDPKWGKPITVTGKVARLSDGRFRYSGGVWEGQEGNMGRTALVVAGAVQILIASNPTYDWADEQFRSIEIETRQAKFIVVKNPMNHRLGYAGIAKERFILDTPGPTPATLRHVEYQRLQRPYYPLDKEIPNLIPAVLRHDQ